jgi:hypothetical protein
VALLNFTDARGNGWRVWNVDTPADRAHLMDASYRNGWLVFERIDGTERRRLAQVPEDWEHLTPDHLYRLCRAATPAPHRHPDSSATTMRMPIVPRPEDFRRDRWHGDD